IGVHVEACRHLHRVLQQIRALGKKASVTLNPHSGIECIDYVLPNVDQVLIMSVNPGFGGQSFIANVLPKIRLLRQEIEARGLSIDIEVDGGIKTDNAPAVAAAGANVLVAGSAIFGHEDYAAIILAMRKNAEAAALTA